jgi:predicted nucleic acid-binding protein
VTVVAVSDTGPLIHLAEIESLDLLSVCDRLYVPETVYEELQHGGVPDGLAALSFELVEARTQPETEQLDPGERAAIAVADDRDAVLLTDDLEARQLASEAGIEVHGSIGVIALGYARGHLDKSEASSRMRSLQSESTLFVTDAVVERGIQML